MMAINRKLQPYRLNPLFSNVTPEIQNFIECTLVVDPFERWPAEQLLHHDWIRKFQPDSAQSAEELMNFVGGKFKPIVRSLLLPLADTPTDSTATSDLVARPQAVPIRKESIWAQLKKCEFLQDKL
jgi:hypothetical protein